MDAVVAQVRSSGVPMKQVDVQRNPDLARELGVQYIPCFVAVVDGKPIDRITGIATAQQLFDLYRQAASIRTDPPIVRGQSADGRGKLAADRILPVRSVAPPAAQPAATNMSPAERLALAATARLKVIDPKGQSYGTGTIVHMHGEEALLVTCGHLFRDSAGQGQILCDLFVDGQPREVPGKLVSFDLRRDVGLVSLRPGGKVTPARLGGNGIRQRPGEPVFAIGCSHGSEPTIIRNQILAVNRYHGPANLVVGGRPVDGRSGGGLFDTAGTLIGVCNAADQQADEGLYAALGPIHAELDASGLSFIYRNSTQMAVPDIDHLSKNEPVPVTPVLPQPPQTYNSREVIVILRDKGDPSYDGQAFVLDHPSDGLLQMLSGELAQRGAHEMTHLHISGAPGGSVVPADGERNGWSPLRRR
jgi:S1-C subfamily serine protease